MKLAFAFLILIGTQTAKAFDITAGLLPPSKQRITLSYSGLFHEKSEFLTERANSSLQEMNFNAPVYKTETESFFVTLKANQFSATPGQGQYSTLTDMQAGLGYTKALDENRLWAITTRYGSASDKPFENSSVTTYGATAFYSFANDEISRWILLVDYSNNRPILNGIPLPGFAYFYNPSKDFRLTVGAPFVSINWTFVENWSLEGFTLVPWILKGSLNYKINDFVKIYTGFDFSQVTYYLSDRTNEKDRLFYDEKKLFVGIKAPLARFVLSEFEFGHAFDRTFFVDENYQIDPNNPVNLGNAFYGKISLRFMF